MAAAPENPRLSKAEEMEKLSETALAFIKEGLTLEENNQETSVRTFWTKKLIVDEIIISNIFRPYYITRKAYIYLIVPLQ